MAFCVLLPCFARGQTADSLALSRLAYAIRELQNSSLMRHGTLGVSITSGATTETLIGVNTDQSLPPASTLKLVTTAAALEVLGENFTFETYLEHDGVLSDGVLKGNLYIRGTGDPSLGSPRFRDRTDSATVFNSWLQAIRNAGIRTIQGRVFADATYFDPLGIGDSWEWGDVANAYGAGISGLNWNENACRIYFRTGARTGDAARLLRIEPALPDTRYVNLVTTGPPGSGDKTLIRPSGHAHMLVIDGTIPRSKREYSIRGAIFNPELLLAGFFTELLIGNDIRVGDKAAVWIPSGMESGTAPARKTLSIHRSPPLSELCRQTNWWSINLYAEAMLKMTAKKMTGKTDFKSATEALISFWVLKGVNVSGMLLRDGSGLSGTALMTPRNVTDILNTVTRFSSFPRFYESIPVAGESGTVRSKSFGRSLNIRAKSGSIEGTRAYAGYINTRSGDRLSFVINAHRYLPDSSGKVVQQLMGVVRLMGEL
ncbi:MAG: D-alanyl-D-alanine carboxypeptidase/D-alanyl-D-alanine-endopeptidase [Cytophagaceae bacterium SCN 52-12]|nr:MAG: D-alanyl-D-alanine carboxypeptidase/D-alanyl-D-alanine-endopeptidase [Cytophagaceae bacterium SCN 52-12]